MTKTSHLFFLFIPALLVVGLLFAVQVYRYEPLYPESENQDSNTVDQQVSIPIFGDDPILGRRSAPITLISFEDFGCARCADQMTLFRALLAEFPDRVKIVFKGLPVTRVPHSSETAHAYGYCANKIGRFEEFEQLAFANGSSLTELVLEEIVTTLEMDTGAFRSCVNSNEPEAYQGKVEALARGLGIQSVPTVFLNGQQLQNPGDIRGWKQALGLAE